MLNISTFLEDSARCHPERHAVVLNDVRLSYADVDRFANQVADLLVSRGIQRGDRVALSCPNLPYFPIIYYGILKAGGVVVPLNVLLKSREIAYHLEDSGAVAYFCFEGSPELPMGQDGHAAFHDVPDCTDFFVITADPFAESPIADTVTFGQALAGTSNEFDPVDTDADDTAVILYTSGTTGRPKGAELTHANIVTNVYAAHRLFEGEQAAETFLVSLPLFHSFGQTLLMNVGVAIAASLVLQPRFAAEEALQLMQSETITMFAGVPTMWWGLLQGLTDDIDVERIAANLRLGISGGASLPVELMRQVQERFGLQVLEGYGLSETSPAAFFSDLARPPRPGSIGVPVWGVRAKLVDPEWVEVDGLDEDGLSPVGEIAIKGHNVMKGYHGRPQATAEVMRDGWFRTGDLARKDEDGFYYIVDRAKDLIIRGGFNVYPREIEEVLMNHPDVSLAAVVGVPHESHGEEIKAFVILEDGAPTSAEDLIAWGREQMASYKYPRLVEVADELPMTATGKVLKRELAGRP
jgi:long-chain acyl-CoA synthetase